LKTVEAERDALLKPATDEAASPAAMLARLKGIGPETAAVLWSEGLFRQFDNRRQVAAYAVWRRRHGVAGATPRGRHYPIHALDRLGFPSGDLSGSATSDPECGS